MPDSFEHMPPIAVRMPNGALTSLAGNLDPEHQVAVADLILVRLDGAHVQPVHSVGAALVYAARASDVDTTIVDVTGPDVTMRWFVDPQSGKILRESYKTMGRSGPVDGETAFSDWKQVDGLNLPFHRDNKQGGQNSSTVQFTSIQLNPTVDPKIFDKPAPAQ